MLGLKLAGQTLVIEERGGKCTCVHFSTRGKPIGVAINVPQPDADTVFKAWKLEGTRSKWKDSKELKSTDFWSTLRSAVRVAVGS